MPRQLTLKIIEIFPSVQGEGLRQGDAAIFIRLSGCNLRCDFCDTKYAWEGGKDFSVDEILARVQKIARHFPARWICLTGGEPLLQNVRPLLRELKALHFKIQVETNARSYQALPVDWWTISPKPKKYFYAAAFQKKANEVKLVASRDLTFDIICRLRSEFPQRTAIILQPESQKRRSMALAIRLLKQAVRAGLPNIRISYQLHKVYDLR